MRSLNQISSRRCKRMFLKFAVLCLFVVVPLCVVQQGFSQHTETITYTYDKLNRLTGVVYSSGAAIIYTYDAAGNRTSIQITGGTSNPVIQSLNPFSTSAGGPQLTVTVNGANFVNGSIVQVNGADRPTTFLSSVQLEVSILVSDLAVEGVINITVVNPGGIVSNAVAFTINAATPTPTPTPSSSPAPPPPSQAQRTFVSTSGNDANTVTLCSRAAPCRGFAAAQTVTLPGGEIIAVDSGGYGVVTITKAIQITAPTGVYVAITGFVGNAITINAGSTDTVVLRGLTLNGLGAQNGVQFNSGAALQVENCAISGFLDNGINFTGSGELLVKDSTVRNTGGAGISIQPLSGNATAALDRTHLFASGSGLIVGSNARATIRNSQSSGHSGAGYSASTAVPATIAELNIEDSVSSNNNVGIGAEGAGAVVRVSNTTITNNGTGILPTSGAILSRGNNTVAGNKVTGAFTGAFVLQ